MIAVLQDAIDCIAKHRHAQDHQGRRLLDEATRWLLAEEPDWPYSFECICAVLDLDANAVRRTLRLPERQSAVASREVKKALQHHEDWKGVTVAVKSCVARRTGTVSTGMLRLEAAVVGALDRGRLFGAGRSARRGLTWLRAIERGESWRLQMLTRPRATVLAGPATRARRPCRRRSSIWWPAVKA